MKAIWNGEVIAESNNTKVVEGNHYFPKDAIRSDYFKPSGKKTVCPWKGTASYYSIEVKGSVNQDAAWYYPAPSDQAASIKDHLAFWKGVEITQ